jgi:hypothetical protein
VGRGRGRDHGQSLPALQQRPSVGLFVRRPDQQRSAGNGQTFNADGTLRPFVHGTATGSAALEIGGDGAYYDSSLLASLKGNQVFGRFDYDLSDSVHAYVQASGNIKTNSNYSDYLTLNKVTINSQNAFLNPTYRDADGRRRAGDLHAQRTRRQRAAPGRQVQVRSADLHRRPGRRSGAYKWGVDFTHGKTELRTTLVNNINNQRLAAALDAVYRRHGQDRLQRHPDEPAYANCVPLNVFGPARPAPRRSTTSCSRPTTRPHDDGRAVGPRRRLAVQHLGRRGQCRAVGRMAEAELRVAQRRPRPAIS